MFTGLAARCDYPLHLGLTEAGMGEGHRRQHRRVGALLQEGIGDTIRVSLTLRPAATAPKKCWLRSRFCSR